MNRGVIFFLGLMALASFAIGQTPVAPPKPEVITNSYTTWDIGIQPEEMVDKLALSPQSSVGYYRSFDVEAKSLTANLDEDSRSKEEAYSINELYGDYTVEMGSVGLFHKERIEKAICAAFEPPTVKLSSGPEKLPPTTWEKLTDYFKKKPPEPKFNEHPYGASKLEDLGQLRDSLKNAAQLSLAYAPEISVPLAEAEMRLVNLSADYTSMRRVAERLAEAYRRNGRADEAHRFLSSGGNWSIPNNRGFLPEIAANSALAYRDTSDFIRMNAALALIKGDTAKAEKIRSDLATYSSTDKIVQRQVKELDRLLARMNKTIADGLKPDEQARMAAALEVANGRMKERTKGVASLDSLDIEVLKKQIEENIQIFGNFSCEACDITLYLLEKRKWTGYHTRPQNMIWQGIHISRAYDAARAIPVFVWAQKSGVLSPQTSGTLYHDRFNAMETGSYISYLLLNNYAAQEQMDPFYSQLQKLNGVCIELAWEPLVKKYFMASWQHRYMVYTAMWRTNDMLKHSEANLPTWEKMLSEPETEEEFKDQIRQYVAEYYHYRAHTPEKAIEWYRTLAKKQQTVGLAVIGMLNLAEEINSEKLWAEGQAIAKRAMKKEKYVTNFKGFEHEINRAFTPITLNKGER